MSGYKIQPGDMRRFKAAFRDSECHLCGTPISRGDPIGYLNYYRRSQRFGPLCLSCLDAEGVRFSLTIIERQEHPE